MWTAAACRRSLATEQAPALQMTDYELKRLPDGKQTLVVGSGTAPRTDAGSSTCRAPTEGNHNSKRRYSVRSIALPARRAPYTLRCDGGGATNLTTCSSRSGLNGFAMQTTAPS